MTSAVINYALAPDYGMGEIVRQARAAVAWLWRNASSLGADRDRIYATGHSAGGHLVTMLLATDWPGFSEDLPADVLKGGCAISGIFDLEPIRRTYLNDVLGMDEETAARNRPLNLTYPVAAPLQIVLGGLESEEYHRQSRAMADLWRGLGYPTELIAPPELDHFSIVDRLDEPHSPLVKAQLTQMGL